MNVTSLVHLTYESDYRTFFLGYFLLLNVLHSFTPQNVRTPNYMMMIEGLYCLYALLSFCSATKITVEEIKLILCFDFASCIGWLYIQ